MQAGVAYPESGSYISGMGAAFTDLDNDGYDDIWHTAVENETFPLFKNRAGSGDFLEMTAASGLSRATRDMSGWSSGAADLDNDGWKDLIVARGNVIDNVALMSLRKYEEPNTIFRNLGNWKFQDVSAEAGADFQKPGAHRGLALGDLDNDGRMDAIVTVLNGPIKYFHNVSSGANHWLTLKLVGVKSNRMGLGARVRITTPDGGQQYENAQTSSGYACSSDPRVHFGLGEAKMAKEIEIVWPSGIHQVLRDVAADRIVTVTEAAR